MCHLLGGSSMVELLQDCTFLLPISLLSMLQTLLMLTALSFPEFHMHAHTKTKASDFNVLKREHK